MGQLTQQGKTSRNDGCVSVFVCAHIQYASVLYAGSCMFHDLE